VKKNNNVILNCNYTWIEFNHVNLLYKTINNQPLFSLSGLFSLQIMALQLQVHYEIVKTLRLNSTRRDVSTRRDDQVQFNGLLMLIVYNS